jgi:hypothetical protein
MQLWETNTAGGYMYSGELSDVMRNALQPMTRFVQHCDADDFTDKGLHAGGAFQWNNYSDITDDFTSRHLDEKQPIPTGTFTVGQNSGTIYEFGKQVPYSGVLDDRSRHPVMQVIKKVLKNHAKKMFEHDAHEQFAATPLKVTPASGNSTTAIELATTGTSPQTNNLAMSNVHVKLIADQLKERDIPVYDDGNYRCIGRPSTFRAFKDDLESVHSYTDDGFRMILNGEIGRSYEGIRFFEQTAISSQSWTNGLSDQAFFFGEDTVIEAIVVPVELRGRLPGDYGRSKGIAWYAQEGFKLANSAAADARIIEWSSVA